LKCNQKNTTRSRREKKDRRLKVESLLVIFVAARRIDISQSSCNVELDNPGQSEWWLQFRESTILFKTSHRATRLGTAPVFTQSIERKIQRD
jgi:hypothetical protein